MLNIAYPTKAQLTLTSPHHTAMSNSCLEKVVVGVQAILHKYLPNAIAISKNYEYLIRVLHMFTLPLPLILSA